MKSEQSTPSPLETCVVCDSEHRKRNALLFDRVHAGQFETQIPSELVFCVPEIDAQIERTTRLRALDDCGVPQEFHYGSDRRSHVEKYAKVGFDVIPSYASHKLFSWDFQPGRGIAYEAALNNIPIISDETVAWDQILEFRLDSEAKRKYRDLRLWLPSALKLSDVGQGTDLISQKIDDYAWAIKKHGLETTNGTLSQVFDWNLWGPTVAAGVTGGAIWATIAAGLSIGVKFVLSLKEKKLDLSNIKRSANREVAILYDIQQTFGDA